MGEKANVVFLVGGNALLDSVFHRKYPLTWALPLNKNAVLWIHKIHVSHRSVFIPMFRESFFMKYCNERNHISTHKKTNISMSLILY